MVFVAELARAAGMLDDATAERHRSVLDVGRACRRRTAGRSGRTCSRRCGSTRSRAATCCASSCSTASAHPVVLEGPDEQDLEEAWAAVSERRARFPFFKDE